MREKNRGLEEAEREREKVSLAHRENVTFAERTEQNRARATRESRRKSPREFLSVKVLCLCVCDTVVADVGKKRETSSRQHANIEGNQRGRGIGAIIKNKLSELVRQEGFLFTDVCRFS